MPRDPYEYVYYKLYLWYMKKWGEQDAPRFTAVLVISLTLVVNLGSIPLVVAALTGVWLFEVPKLTRIEWAIPMIAFIWLNYVALARRSRHEAIVRKFENETKEQSRRGNRFVLLYVVGSLLFLFASGFGVYLRDIMTSPRSVDTETTSSSDEEQRTNEPVGKNN